MLYRQFIYYTLLLTGGIFISFLSAHHASYAQDRTQSAQEISLGIYSALRQGGRPEGIAVQLSRAIVFFRQSCSRLNEYQVYHEQPNMIVLKVSCIAAPPYGVSVAANGYLAVYGGNGILAPLDPRDGRIYAFRPDGTLEPEASIELRRYLQRGVEKAKMGDPNNLFYLMVAFSLLAVIVLVAVYMWVRNWRRMSYSAAYNNLIPSEVKDALLAESVKLAPRLYQHGDDFYIARGRRGKRRLFKTRLGAEFYKRFSLKFGEIIYMDTHHSEALQSAPEAEEDSGYTPGDSFSA